MTLPDYLLDAILCATDDEAEQERLAREWRRRLPEMEAAAERIRVQVRDRVCRCQLDPESITDDGRCGRCFGRRES